MPGLLSAGFLHTFCVIPIEIVGTIGAILIQLQWSLGVVERQSTFLQGQSFLPIVDVCGFLLCRTGGGFSTPGRKEFDGCPIGGEQVYSMASVIMMLPRSTSPVMGLKVLTERNVDRTLSQSRSALAMLVKLA